jgi:hypothetical protein
LKDFNNTNKQSDNESEEIKTKRTELELAVTEAKNKLAELQNSKGGRRTRKNKKVQKGKKSRKAGKKSKSVRKSKRSKKTRSGK